MKFKLEMPSDISEQMERWILGITFATCVAVVVSMVAIVIASGGSHGTE